MDLFSTIRGLGDMYSSIRLCTTPHVFNSPCLFPMYNYIVVTAGQSSKHLCVPTVGLCTQVYLLLCINGVRCTH